MRRASVAGLRAVQLVSAFLCAAPVLAQDEEPDLDFLEYLGSWEDDDESWYVEVQIAEADDEGNEEADEDAPRSTRVEHDDD